MSKKTETPGPGFVAATELMGPDFWRGVQREGQDIEPPIKAEGPGKRVKFCQHSDQVLCKENKCTVACDRHPWHREYKQGYIHDENGFYAAKPPIKPGPPK